MGDINPRPQSVFDLELSTVHPRLLYTPLLASNVHAGRYGHGLLLSRSNCARLSG